MKKFLLMTTAVIAMGFLSGHAADNNNFSPQSNAGGPECGCYKNPRAGESSGSPGLEQGEVYGYTNSSSGPQGGGEVIPHGGGRMNYPPTRTGTPAFGPGSCDRGTPQGGSATASGSGAAGTSTGTSVGVTGGTSSQGANSNRNPNQNP